MKIFAKPDTQDWPLDPVYPRGLMYFQDDDGGELSLGHVWLDEWLRTLISGYEQLKWQECDSLTGQIDSKRESIVWSRQAGDVYLSISNHKLTIRDLHAFTRWRSSIRRRWALSEVKPSWSLPVSTQQDA